MRSFILHVRQLDWSLIVASVLLVGIGLVSIYSSSLGRDDFLNFKKQIVFFGIGVVLMFLVSFFDWRAFRENSYFILALYGLFVLALLGLFFFAPTIRGIKGWYNFGFVSFDPIELTKIILVILLAKFFSMRHVEMYRLRHIFLSGLYVFVPVVLIFFQPDLGSALILIALWVGVLVVSGIKLRHFLILVLCGVIVAVAGWSFLLKDYQKDRIAGFLVPEADPMGISWNQIQSKIAIGSGGIFGQGFGEGSQTQYRFLPEPQTDFIFAAIAEEFGLVGVSVLLLLFIILIWRVLKITLSAQSNFPRLFASGFAVIIISQVFIHIGMNLGILPVIGIPLPLVTYGGSSLLATFVGLGILQSIRTH